MSDETDELGAGEQELADHLSSDPPTPAPGFRGALGRHLGAIDPGWGPRPERLRVMVMTGVVSGLVLMALGLLQATGSL